MRYSLLLFFCVLLASLFAASGTLAAERPNVLLLCVDDLRPELNCFGKDYIHSPNIDALAAGGRAFHRHYVQAPTCGASRYTLLTGRYGPRSNSALFARARQMAKDPDSVPPSMPTWFRRHGYTTVSIGKVSHHPGGRGGRDWNDDEQHEMPGSWDRHLLPSGPWQHPRGFMHGLAHGEIRIQAGDMDVYQSEPGPDSIYPDGRTVDESLRQLRELASDEKPFFLAVGIIRPHLPFGAPAKYFEPYRDAILPAIPHSEKPKGKTTWHGSGEFMKYNRWERDPNEDGEFATLVRKHYAACVSYADAQVGRVLTCLDELGCRKDTIVVLWGDHGWHLGEHAIWGKHALFEESLHSPLIINYKGIPHAGQATHSMVETLDVFPTLCDLAGLPAPDFAHGVSLRPILESPDAPGHAAISYARGRTIRSETHRLIAHSDGYVELYDHTSAAGETQNVADDQPARVQKLMQMLDERLPKDRPY
jgi:iduronate 2-sulfatase